VRVVPVHAGERRVGVDASMKSKCAVMAGLYAVFTVSNWKGLA
jgi:hypothetical protein